jgi:hypothetical protein
LILDFIRFFVVYFVSFIEGAGNRPEKPRVDELDHWIQNFYGERWDENEVNRDDLAIRRTESFFTLNNLFPYVLKLYPKRNPSYPLSLIKILQEHFSTHQTAIWIDCVPAENDNNANNEREGSSGATGGGGGGGEADPTLDADEDDEGGNSSKNTGRRMHWFEGRVLRRFRSRHVYKLLSDIKASRILKEKFMISRISSFWNSCSGNWSVGGWGGLWQWLLSCLCCCCRTSQQQAPAGGSGSADQRKAIPPEVESRMHFHGFLLQSVQGLESYLGAQFQAYSVPSVEPEIVAGYSPAVGAEAAGVPEDLGAIEDVSIGSSDSDNGWVTLQPDDVEVDQDNPEGDHEAASLVEQQPAVQIEQGQDASHSVDDEPVYAVISS